MSEVDSLFRRADKYIKSARILLDEGDYESCVSRAYYAMFFVAEAALLSKGLSYSSHAAVISSFGEQFVKGRVVSRDAGRNLRRAFEKRQLSDYESTFVITRDEAKEILDQAKAFREEVGKLLIG